MKLLILEGHDILTTTRRAEKVSETKLFFDYTNESSYVSLIHKLKHEKIDAALFFAGIHKGPSFELNQLLEIDLKNTIEIFVVNALGPAKLIELLIFENILNDDARLLILSSRAGSSAERGKLSHHRPGGDIIYRGSRALLNNLIRNISFDHQSKNLSIIAVHPGWVKTNAGGMSADLSIEEASRCIYEIFKRINKKISGLFLNYNGKIIDW
jgi:NAD(P)-dependent dehydrogenase (short-subunit alcohol dehydrogenase family)